ATIASAPDARASACCRAARSATRAECSASTSSGRISGVVTTRLSHERQSLASPPLSLSQTAPGISRPPAPAQHRIAPINPFKHVGQLSCGNRHRAVSRRRPYKPAALQPLGVERHADPVMPENLDQLTALAAEHIQIAGVRIALQ